MSILDPNRNILGKPGWPHWLALADSRHVERRTGNRMASLCAHDGEDWPCDARRTLDALTEMEADRDRWREHVDADHTIMSTLRATIVDAVRWAVFAGLPTAEGIADRVLDNLGTGQ